MTGGYCDGAACPPDEKGADPRALAPLTALGLESDRLQGPTTSTSFLHEGPGSPGRKGSSFLTESTRIADTAPDTRSGHSGRNNSEASLSDREWNKGGERAVGSGFVSSLTATPPSTFGESAGHPQATRRAHAGPASASPAPPHGQQPHQTLQSRRGPQQRPKSRSAPQALSAIHSLRHKNQGSSQPSGAWPHQRQCRGTRPHCSPSDNDQQ